MFIHDRPARQRYRSCMAPQAKAEGQPINVHLPRELHQAIIDRAQADDRSLSQTIRVALRYYLKRTAPEAPATERGTAA